MTPQLNEKESLIAQIEQKDVLYLIHLKISNHSPTCFMRQRQEMILVVSIKMTLYRLAVRSQVVDALVEAAENGKEVWYL